MDVGPLIRRFEAKDHFRTYELETSASISANASVLRCLVETQSPAMYVDQIGKAAAFLCQRWRTDTFVDKWVYLPGSYLPLAELADAILRSISRLSMWSCSECRPSAGFSA